MGLFSSSKTTTTVESTNNTNITVNPLNAITIDTSAQAGAINAGVQAIDKLVENAARGLGGALSTASATIGGGIGGAGVNLAFGLMAGASVYAIARAGK